MTEIVNIQFKGQTYQYNIIRSNNSIERVDFLLRPADARSNLEKRLINANELWFTWREEIKQFFTTNLKVAMDPELFTCFSNALMKFYINAHSGSKQRTEENIVE